VIFARLGKGYVGLWDTGAVEMRVDQIRRRSGELHAELSVSSAATPVGHGAIHRASFNVSSSTTRERLGKTLADRSRLPIQWSDYLEDFCAAIIDAEAAGSPIIEVGLLPPAPAEEFLIDPFLPARKATIIFAPGGVGKSYLSVLCSVAVASGTPILNWRVKQARVLYLDWETDKNEVDERVKRVSKGLGIEPPALLYRSCAGPIDAMAESVSAAVSREGIGLVVVDSVAMASPARGEFASAEESAIALFSTLRYIGTTALLIDHVKGEDADRDDAISKPYGSIYKMNLARSVWELKGGTGSEGSDRHVGLFHRKVNKGFLLPSVGIAVRHTDDAVTFATEPIIGDLAKGLSLSVRIQRELAHGAKTTDELADFLGAKGEVLRATLNRGRGTLFIRLEDGRWGNLHHDV
jgi:hypothetical protein